MASGTIMVALLERRDTGQRQVTGHGTPRRSRMKIFVTGAAGYIDDLVDLYLLALDRAPGGSFFFAENGSESFDARRLGWSPKVPSLAEWLRSTHTAGR
jgi:hypothetical protein